MANYVRTTDSI